MIAQELISRIHDLPPASPGALRLVNLLNQSAIDNDEIIQALKCDTVLTAKLLRVCNSSYFAFQEPVASVDQAVLMLGHQEVLRIVLGIAYGGLMAAPVPGYAVEANELWRHSLVTGTAAEVVVAEGLDGKFNAAVAFTVGLLHDIGKLVLGQVLTPELQTEIRSRIKSQQLSRAEAEKQILGTDHAEVGGQLLQSWRLPAQIVEAVANHHQPVLKPQPGLSVVAHLANCLAHLSGSAPGWDAYAVRVCDRVAETFNLTAERLEIMIISVREASERVDQLTAVE